jgi:hypothetical protein
MEKNIRVFGDKECVGCRKIMELTKTSDVIVDNKNIKVEHLFVDEHPEEWEKIMKRTGVWFLPHIEVTYYDTVLKKREEIHLSSVRDFEEVDDAWEELKEIMKDNYHNKPNKMSEVEMTERIKSLTIMQEKLYENMKKNIKYFTNLRNFLNMSASQLEAEPQDTNNYI